MRWEMHKPLLMSVVLIKDWGQLSAILNAKIEAKKTYLSILFTGNKAVKVM